MQVDLRTCMHRLATRESELSERIEVLTAEARKKSAMRDIAGAKRKIIERSVLLCLSASAEKKRHLYRDSFRRRRCHEQLLRVNNSICIIDSHTNAIEGTELNKSILNTIRASGDAIKRLSVKGGMSTVEDIISEVETQMENASEITKVISAGSCPT